MDCWVISGVMTVLPHWPTWEDVWQAMRCLCLKGKGDCAGKLFVRAKIKGNTSPSGDNAFSARYHPPDRHSSAPSSLLCYDQRKLSLVRRQKPALVPP